MDCRENWKKVLFSDKSHFCSRLSAWLQLGGGHGGRVLPIFKMGGHNIPCPPLFDLLEFNQTHNAALFSSKCETFVFQIHHT